MSSILKRSGCSLCGKFTMSLDQAKDDMRRAATRYQSFPTQRNRDRADKAARSLAAAREIYRDHQAECALRRNQM